MNTACRTHGIGAHAGGKIFDIIVEINRGGTTIMLVEQNASMALAIAHRAYVLETGTVVLSGNAGELAKNTDVRKAYLGE